MPYKDNTLFIHIPKTGGTSINKILGITKKEHLFSTKMPILQHLTPNEVKELIGKEKFDAAKKITVIRNPLEKAVSDYSWIKNRLPLYTFREYLQLSHKVISLNLYNEGKYYNHFRPQVHFFTGIDYDEVIDFDNFEAEVKRVFNVTKVPHLNRKRLSISVSPEDALLHRNLYDEDYKMYNKYQIDNEG